MKSLKDYLEESQHWMENPAVGDDFAINIKEDCLIESHIIAVEEDRLCIEADSKLIAILESYGYTVEEICSECMQEACVCEDLDEAMSVDDVLVSEDPTQEEPMTPGVNDPDGTTADDPIGEAEYQGRKVKLGKIMQGDVKKFKVYVKNDKGNVVKVNFGFGGKSAKGKRMVIKKNNPARRKSFRARHHCETPGPRWKARYWACKTW